MIMWSSFIWLNSACIRMDKQQPGACTLQLHTTGFQGGTEIRSSALQTDSSFHLKKKKQFFKIYVDAYMCACMYTYVDACACACVYVYIYIRYRYKANCCLQLTENVASVRQRQSIPVTSLWKQRLTSLKGLGKALNYFVR